MTTKPADETTRAIVAHIRAPGELTKDDAVEAFSRVACEAIEGA